MDRPAQKPPEPAGAADSPLSFPVEAPKLADVEPGAGAPPGSAAEATLPRQGDPLAFPSEPPAFSAEAAAAPPPAFPAAAGPRADPPLFPAEPAASPLAFPAAAAPRTDPPLFPAEPAAPAEPLAFPAAATPLTDPPLFPAQPTTAPPAAPAGQLPFPVAELPDVAAIPQPAPPADPVPTPAPAPASRLPRFLPAALVTLAAILAVGGCFLPLFQMIQELTFRQGFDDARLTITETAWGNLIEVSGQEPDHRPGVPVGIPVIAAIVLLAVGAFAAFSRPERGLTRWLLSAGAVFAAGVVATIGMTRFQLAAIAGQEVNLEVTTGPGMWLLILATVTAAGAAVLVHLPLRRPGWADPAVAYADTPTPPSGIAITVLPPEEQDREPPLR